MSSTNQPIKMNFALKEVKLEPSELTEEFQCAPRPALTPNYPVVQFNFKIDPYECITEGDGNNPFEIDRLSMEELTCAQERAKQTLALAAAKASRTAAKAAAKAPKTRANAAVKTPKTPLAEVFPAPPIQATPSINHGQLPQSSDRIFDENQENIQPVDDFDSLAFTTNVFENWTPDESVNTLVHHLRILTNYIAQ